MDAAELRRVLVLANPFKEGDLRVGGTRDDAVRQDARRALEACTLGAIAAVEVVEDGVTEALARGRDRALAADMAGLTVAKLRSVLLGAGGPAWVARYRDGLPSEAIAAVVKVMDDAELATVARRLFNPLPAHGGGVAIGAPSHFGSRIQPNSPSDDPDEVLFAVLEGLTYGCGDVILGINPASDDVDTICRLESLLGEVVDALRLPTRFCVLSDIVKQDVARSRVRVDVAFQSLAGTSAALQGMVGLDADGLLDLARGFDGLYFETGQGAEVTNGADAGVDMVTLESRTYGLARWLARRSGENGVPRWTIVNDVAGFIGPEVFRTGAQLRRACLEDSVMAKLHGLTMGLDVCSTFHMGIDPESLRELTRDVVQDAAPAFLMAVAGNADPMLGYLTTSFRDHPRLRRAAGRAPTTTMRDRLVEIGALDAGGEVRSSGERVAALYAAFRRGGGDTGDPEALRAEGARTLTTLQERGFDLGIGHGPGHDDPPAAAERTRRIFRHARHSLFAALDPARIEASCLSPVLVRSTADDRDAYLADPSSGERIREADLPRIGAMYPARRPAVQVVVSDGLNADAVNLNLPLLLPPLRQALRAAGVEVGAAEVVVTNGRVRAGYHVGALLRPEVIVHLIGERPGTGLSTVSAYLTYGRDEAGGWRWRPEMDHSWTTAVCGIHPAARPPEAAAGEIARYVAHILEARRSGVALSSAPS